MVGRGLLRERAERLAHRVGDCSRSRHYGQHTPRLVAGQHRWNQSTAYRTAHSRAWSAGHTIA
jgi:hypothetical protein